MPWQACDPEEVVDRCVILGVIRRADLDSLPGPEHAKDEVMIKMIRNRKGIVTGESYLRRALHCKECGQSCGAILNSGFRRPGLCSGARLMRLHRELYTGWRVYWDAGCVGVGYREPDGQCRHGLPSQEKVYEVSLDGYYKWTRRGARRNFLIW